MNSTINQQNSSCIQDTIEIVNKIHFDGGNGDGYHYVYTKNTDGHTVGSFHERLLSEYLKLFNIKWKNY